MGAQGAIVGSVILDMIAKGAIAEELYRFVRSLKQSTRALSAEIKE